MRSRVVLFLIILLFNLYQSYWPRAEEYHACLLYTGQCMAYLSQCKEITGRHPIWYAFMEQCSVTDASPVTQWFLIFILFSLSVDWLRDWQLAREIRQFGERERSLYRTYHPSEAQRMEKKKKKNLFLLNPSQYFNSHLVVDDISHSIY